MASAFAFQFSALLLLSSSASALTPTQQPSSSSSRGLQQPSSRPSLQSHHAAGGDDTLQDHLVAAKAPEKKAQSSLKGYLAVMGGVMIHLTCGSMYCWGNLISYTPARLKYWSPFGGIGPMDAQLVLAFTLISQMSGMPLGPYLERQLGPRLTACLGALMMGAGVFFSSYARTLLEFVLAYSVLFGLGVGVAYQMPFLTGARWFPASQGAIQGCILSGLGASAFLFNLLATKLVNPNGANMVDGSFPPEVAANWPPMLRTLGALFTCLALGGALLQANPPSAASTPSTSATPYPAIQLLQRLTGTAPPATPTHKAATRRARVPPPAKPADASSSSSPPPSVLSHVQSGQFWLLWVMILTSAVSGLNIASSYKTFGAKQPHLNSDAFLAAVGALAALGGNAAGRLAWGALSDALGFKTCFSALTLLQGLVMYNYGRLSAHKATFLLATVFMLFCMGGNFAMFPAQTFRVFGATQGAQVYSALFTAFGSAALLGPILSTALLQSGGWPLVYTTLSLLSALAFTLCRLFL